MKCVCTRKCQVRVDSRIHTFNRGDVFDFKKCPNNFRKINAKPVDFLKAKEAELLEAEWQFEDAEKAIKAEFNVDLKREKKPDVVAQILDARYRKVD